MAVRARVNGASAGCGARLAVRASKKGERRCACGSMVTASGGVDPDRWCHRCGAVLWLVAAREGLDDEHAATAARARRCQHPQLISLGGSVRLWLCHAGWHGKQLARPRDVGGAIAIGE